MRSSSVRWPFTDRMTSCCSVSSTTAVRSSCKLVHEASVPFLLSSAGYGFLWHNPAVGRATFGHNCTEWTAESTQQFDYWISAAEMPAQILAAYADATGHVPAMPEYGLGLWQSKLRYISQEQLLEVAREYRRRDLPLDVIVADFFHWPKMGDVRIDWAGPLQQETPRRSRRDGANRFASSRPPGLGDRCTRTRRSRWAAAAVARVVRRRRTGTAAAGFVSGHHLRRLSAPEACRTAGAAAAGTHSAAGRLRRRRVVRDLKGQGRG